MRRILCKSITLSVLALFGIAALTAPAMAQVCSGTNVVTALGPLINKVPGTPPSPQSTALVRYAFGNDVTSDCDLDTSNGGVQQTVTQVIIRPSCNISGGACLPDGGGDDGDPNTPAVAFLSLDATTCLGGLANITIDASNPYAVALNFTVPIVFAPNTNCSVDISLHVRERGNATTTTTVAQQYATDGTCACEPPLNAGGNTSSQITLTCPACSTNFCAPELCNATTALCEPQTPPDCSNPDNDLCTPGSCDSTANKGNGACVDGPRTVCGNESNFCAPGHCDATTGGCVLDKPPVCPNSFCAPGHCDTAANSCVLDTPPTCPSSFCAPGHCDVAAGACVLDTPPVCTGNFCKPSHCDNGAGACVPDTPPNCDDGNACTDDKCDPATGACVNTPRPTDDCDDGNVCTDDKCNPATGCVNTPKPPDFCDDKDQCTDDVCDPTDGCVHSPADPLPAACGAAICRTPGFWGTHAGTEKNNSTNITEAVIDCADGNCADHTASDFLLICGEKIDSPDSFPANGTTDTNDAASSTEAICVPPQGDSRLQLARQLTSAALNCIISGGGADCAGTSLYTSVFTDCNAKCASGTASQSEVTACISQLDCLNNGKTFLNGLCSSGGPGNCHERILVNEDLGLDFDPPGAAGSSNACNAANGTPCTVVGPGEARCTRDSLP